MDPTIDDSRTGRPTTEVIAEHNRYKTRRDPRGANPALPRVVWLQVREMFDADRPRPELAPLPLVVGSRVEISQPRIPTGTYTVTALEPGSAFTWEQRQPGSTVSAHHECAPLPEGGTRVELRVVMSGAIGGSWDGCTETHRAVPRHGGGRPQGPCGGHRSLKRRGSNPPVTRSAHPLSSGGGSVLR